MDKIDIYLATPYSHEDRAVECWRYERVTEAAAVLINRGVKAVYSPITHTHPMTCCKVPTEHTYKVWLAFDYAFLDNCERLLILCLPGWEKSVGVKAEIETARGKGIPIEYADPIYDDMFRLVNLRHRWAPGEE